MGAGQDDCDVGGKRIGPRWRPTAMGSRVPDMLSDVEWGRLVAALRLSPREDDMLRGMFYDERVDSIARTLGLSKHTVRTYRDRLYRKLGIGTCAQLLALAFSVHLQLAISRQADTRRVVDPLE